MSFHTSFQVLIKILFFREPVSWAHQSNFFFQGNFLFRKTNHMMSVVKAHPVLILILSSDAVFASPSPVLTFGFPRQSIKYIFSSSIILVMRGS